MKLLSRTISFERGLRVLACVFFAALLQRPAMAAEPPDVVVSIKPLHALLAGLMRGVGEPRLLIDGAVAPWDYRPNAEDAAAIAAADAVVWSGRELEPALAELVHTQRPQGQVFEALADDAVKVLPSRFDDAQRDPFYWLDSRNMLILLDELRHLLVEIDPARAAVYERNGRGVSQVLAGLDRSLEFGYRDVSGVPVFFYHDTHRYFEQAYAMFVAGTVVEVAAGEHVDTARLLSVRGGVLAAGRSCLFTEKGLQAPHLNLLQDGSEAITVELDSLGVDIEPGPDAYEQLMRQNFAAISACVRQTRPQTAGTDAALPAELPDVDGVFRPRYLLMDQYGRSVSQEDFPGRLQLIYFGYTFCPDVCPTSLAVMSQALRLLGEQADAVQPIFITVDPTRDTPDKLGEYAAYFNKNMLALWGKPDVIQGTAERFRARYEKVASDSGDPQRYTMDHTASLYLLGRNGEFLTKFAHGLPAVEVAERLRDYLQD